MKKEKKKITYVGPVGTERKNITINPDVWKEAGVILKESGYSRSRYIEIMFRSIIDMQTKPYLEVAQDHANMLFKENKVLNKKHKEEE